MNHGVALDNPFRDRRIHTAGDEYWLHAGLNMLVGVADGVSRRSGARGHDVAVSAKAKFHADFAGDGPHGSARYAEDADLFFFAAVPKAIHLFGKFLSA